MSLSSIAVVGTGPSGLSIVEAIAQAEMSVLAVCVTGARRGLARKRLRKTLSMRVDIGELTAEEADAILSRVEFTRDISVASDCDLVIESTVGDVRARRAVLATLEGSISRGSVLASNIGRSELPKIAEVLERKDQFLGLRFFHPATHTPLVEVVDLPETAPGARLTCETFVRWLGKTPVHHVEGTVEPVLSVPALSGASGR